MKKSIVLVSIALSTALLCSCLQLHAKIADEICELYNLREATPKVFTKKFDGHPLNYSLLGEVVNKEGKTKKLYLIQLPSHKQRRNPKCGAHAYENCKVLSQKNLNLAKVVEILNSEKQKEKISAIKFCMRDNYQVEKRKKQDEEERGAKYNFKIVEINRTNDWSKIKPTIPGVYMIRTYQYEHWIAVRVEETKNGNIVILVTDSYHPFNDNRVIGPTIFAESLIKGLGYSSFKFFPLEKR